jgi:urease accessory protein
MRRTGFAAVDRAFPAAGFGGLGDFRLAGMEAGKVATAGRLPSEDGTNVFRRTPPTPLLHPSGMEIIRGALPSPIDDLAKISIPIDRYSLAKRRWRGVADDGREFGFDLEAPLPDGAAVFRDDAGVYVIAQKYEPVLEVQSAVFGDRSPAAAARLGWMIGNLHFQIEITGEIVRVVDDPAVRQLFDREHIPYTACKRVFHPLAGGHRH